MDETPDGGRHLARRPPSGPSSRWSPLPIAAMVLAVLVIATGGYLLLNRPSTSESCRSGNLQLQVVAAPDQADLISQAAADYERSRPTVGDQCVDVVVRPLESAQATAALAKGWKGAEGPHPDVWVPASSAWANQLRLALEASNQPDLVPTELPKVATSPLVIAMPRPMALALGWPRRALGWSDLLGLLQKGWAAANQPKWGAFKLGKTDPNVSTPALEALVGTVFAATGKGSDVTVADLQARSDELRKVILGVERSPGPDADVPGTLLANLRRADQGGGALGFVSAVPVDEKSVLDYNKGNPSGDQEVTNASPPRVPLVAVYPKEGTLEADHPWITLQAPWVDEAKRRAAAGFYGYLGSAEVQARFQKAGFRSATGAPGQAVDEVNGLVPGQPSNVLQAPDPRVVTAALQGWNAARKRGNVLAVFDVSGSMKEVVPGTAGRTKIDLVKGAAIASLKLFAPEDNVGSWEFSTDLGGVAGKDWRETVPIGPVGAELSQGRTRLEMLAAADSALQATNGDTALYETTLAAVQYVKQHYVPDRINTVVLLTDGINDDPDGNFNSLPNLLAQLKKAQGDQPVRVITIAYGADADSKALAQIAKATGGVPFQSRDPRDIVRIFTSVIASVPSGGSPGVG
ncbi:MAG TPA: substrate-binding domain-containing protein [Actinomycetes bacterium]|nr:substrate-binding domain-containing protein [Actinomycetes bacterium]